MENGCDTCSKTNILEVEALGRPFALGLLYDANRDILIPSLSLWNAEVLSQHVREFDFFATDTAIDVSDSVKDNVNTTGSDKNKMHEILLRFLKESSTGAYSYKKKNAIKKNEETVTMRYLETKKRRELSVDLLGDESYAQTSLHVSSRPYLDLATKVQATHVVIGITYGTKVCIEFSRRCSNEVESSVAMDDLKDALDFVVFSKDKTSEWDKVLESKVSDRKFEVRLYGDICLVDRCPTTINDGVELFRKLPQVLSNSSTPIKISLLPLAFLDPRFPMWKIRATAEEIKIAGGIFQQLEEAEMKCNDLLGSTTSRLVSELKNKPKQISAYINEYRLKLQQELATCYGEKGSEQETAAKFDHIVTEHRSSPFTDELMNKVLDEIEQETVYIDAVIKAVHPAAIVHREVDIQSRLNGREYAIGLDVVLYIESVPFIQMLNSYLNASKREDKYTFTPIDVYKKVERRQNMQEKLQEFKKLAQANHGNKQCSILCYIKGIPDNTDVTQFAKPNLKIYSGDYLLPDDFKMPPVPGGVSLSTYKSEVSVKWECRKHHGDYRVVFTSPDYGEQSVTINKSEITKTLQKGEWKVVVYAVVGDDDRSYFGPGSLPVKTTIRGFPI